MKLWILFKESMRYIFRSRLLVLLLIFSFLLHYVGLSIVKNTFFSEQGLISVVGPRQGMFVSIYLSLFMGVFIAIIYGVWMVPYLHQGDRSLLTFVLPVSKWSYPIVYFLSFLVLILLECGILVGSFGWIFGKSALALPKFSWPAIASCLLLIVLVGEFLLFCSAILSLVVGQLTTIFLMSGAFISLQVLGTLFRFGLDQYAQEQGGKLLTAYQIYRFFPPLGELIFTLKQTYSQGDFPRNQVALWILWVTVGFLLFRWTIRYPRT